MFVLKDIILCVPGVVACKNDLLLFGIQWEFHNNLFYENSLFVTSVFFLSPVEIYVLFMHNDVMP